MQTVHSHGSPWKLKRLKDFIHQKNKKKNIKKKRQIISSTPDCAEITDPLACTGVRQNFTTYMYLCTSSRYISVWQALQKKKKKSRPTTYHSFGKWSFCVVALRCCSALVSVWVAINTSASIPSRNFDLLTRSYSTVGGEVDRLNESSLITQCRACPSADFCVYILTQVRNYTFATAPLPCPCLLL